MSNGFGKMYDKYIQEIPFIYLSKNELVWEFLFLAPYENICQVFMKVQDKWEVSYLRDYPSDYKKDNPNINISKRIVAFVLDKLDKEIKIAVMPIGIASYIAVDGYYYRIQRSGSGLDTRYRVDRRKQRTLTEAETACLEEYRKKVPSLVDAIVSENKIPLTQNDFRKVQHRCELLEMD